MKKIPVFLLLLFGTPLFGQSWVSISNEYVRISVDSASGRYLVSDSANIYPAQKSVPAPLPSYLPPVSPNEDILLTQSGLLGSVTTAANALLLNVNGAAVFFGSLSGRFVGSPRVEGKQISYTWSLGSLRVTQILSIITNGETLLEDAVSIRYHLENNSDNVQLLGARIVLDSIPGDGQDIAFRAEGLNVRSEARFGRTTMPDSWFSTDRNGMLSPYTIRGFLKSSSFSRPDTVLFTTLAEALRPTWDHSLVPSRSLSGADAAVALSFDPIQVAPKSARVVGTLVGISGILTEQNQGLKVNVSSFSRQEENPALVGLWLSNSSPQSFEQVLLNISVPPTLRVLSQPLDNLTDLRPGEERYVEWRLSSTTDDAGSYPITVNVYGVKDGENAARITVPFNISWASNSVREENALIQEALSNRESTPVLPPDNAPVPQLILADRFPPDAPLGATSESLIKLKESLRQSRIDNVEEIITLIDSELQLIKEINQAQWNINEIDLQYTVQRRIYQQLYEKDQPIDDRLPLNLQGIEDSLQTSEQALVLQQKTLEGILGGEKNPLEKSP